MNHPPQFRKITTILLLVLLFSVPALFADGIASRYPNDVGIGNDPLVLLFDGFENYVQASDVRIENGGVWDTGGGNYTDLYRTTFFREQELRDGFPDNQCRDGDGVTEVHFPGRTSAFREGIFPV